MPPRRGRGRPKAKKNKASTTTAAVDEEEPVVIDGVVVDTDDPEVLWANSEARRLLAKDLADGVIPLEPCHSMPTREIFTSRPEYAEYGYTLFSSRLSGLRKIFARDMDQAKDDMAAFADSRLNNTIHTHNTRGYPEWDGSKAQSALNDDIEMGLTAEMEPAELWEFRLVYKEFPLEVFRDHIYQKLKTDKYLHTLEVKGKAKRKPK